MMNRTNRNNQSQISLSPLKTQCYPPEIYFQTGMLLRISIQDSDGIAHSDTLICSASVCNESQNTYRLSINENRQPAAVFLTPDDTIKLSFEIKNSEISQRFLPYSYFLSLHTNNSYKWLSLFEESSKSNGKSMRQQNVLFYFERVPLQTVSSQNTSTSPFRQNNSIDKQANQSKYLTPSHMQQHVYSSSKKSEKYRSTESSNYLVQQNRENSQNRKGSEIILQQQASSSNNSIQKMKKSTLTNVPVIQQQQPIITELQLENRQSITNSESQRIRQKKTYLTTPPPIKTGNDYSSISANSEIPRSLQNQFNGSPQSSVHDIFLPEFTPFKQQQNSQNSATFIEQTPQKEHLRTLDHAFVYNQKEIENRDSANERLRMMICEFYANQQRMKKEEDLKVTQLQQITNQSKTILKRTEEIEENIQTLWQKEHKLEENNENLVEASFLIEEDTKQILSAIGGMRNFRLASNTIEQFENLFKFVEFKTSEMSQVYQCIYETKLNQLQIERKRDILFEKKQEENKEKRGYSLYYKVTPEKNMNAKTYLDILKLRNKKCLSPQLIIGKNPSNGGSEFADELYDKSKRLLSEN